MAPARPHMSHIHSAYQVHVLLVHTLCDTHYTSTRGTLAISTAYNDATTVMQSVAILKYEKTQHIFIVVVCCSADAHLHPTTYGDGHIIFKPTVSNIGHATVIL